MGDGIDHDIENDGRKDPVSADQREIWLLLSTDTDFALAIICADVFTDCRVLD